MDDEWDNDTNPDVFTSHRDAVTTRRCVTCGHEPDADNAARVYRRGVTDALEAVRDEMVTTGGLERGQATRIVNVIAARHGLTLV